MTAIKTALAALATCTALVAQVAHATPEDKGWIRVGSDAEVTLYAKLPVLDGPTRAIKRMWTREDGATGAVVALEEIDCVQHRVRLLNMTSFSDHDLTTVTNSDQTPSQWYFNVPGSQGEDVEKAACS